MRESPARFLSAWAYVDDYAYVNSAVGRQVIGSVRARIENGEIIAPAKYPGSDDLNAFRDRNWRPTSAPLGGPTSAVVLSPIWRELGGLRAGIAARDRRAALA